MEILKILLAIVLCPLVGIVNAFLIYSLGSYFWGGGSGVDFATLMTGILTTLVLFVFYLDGVKK